MSSWSIKKSINVLAAAMLGVLVIISVVGIGSTLRLTAATEQFSDAAQQTKDLAELEGLLLEGRLAAVLYRMSATEERAEIVVTNLSAILEAGAQLGSLYVGDPEMLEKLDQLKADLVAYKDHFSAMRDLRAEREAHVAVTTAAGKEARELITSIIETPVATISPFVLAAAGLAQQNFILSRLYLERFLLTNEQAAFETSLQTIEQSKDQLSSIAVQTGNPQAAESAQRVLDLIDTFWDAAEGANQAILLRNEERAAMDQIGPRALDDIVEMLTLIAERTDMIGNSAATVGTVTISLLLALSILCVVGSGYFAYFLSSRIGNAIGDSIEDMQSLAAGNIDLEIRGTDSETEL